MNAKLCCNCHAAPRSGASYCADCKRAYEREYARSRRTGVRRRKVAPDGYKYCPSCKSLKPITEFRANASKAGGLSGWCSKCDSRASADYRARQKRERFASIVRRARGTE